MDTITSKSAKDLMLSRSYYPIQYEVYDWCKANLSHFTFETIFGSTIITIFEDHDENTLREFGETTVVKMLKEYHGKNAKPL